MFYVVDLFVLLGIKGFEIGFLVMVFFGIIKLIVVIVCVFFLVDVIGRKRVLIGGIVF